jgi:Putative peptidoglycan binding domain
MTGAPDTYPHHLAGDDAPAPHPPAARLVDMARRAAARSVPPLEADRPVFGAGEWRMAASLVVLGSEANAANPVRDKTSDGTIADARHRELGDDSDHNPWLVYKGMGICRARDIDASGLDIASAFERARQAAYKDPTHPLRGGGYLIFNGRITRPDFTGWVHYTGDSPHVLHGHVSVSTDPARFDDRRTWGIFVTPTKTPAKTAPAKAPAKAQPVEKANVRWLEQGPDHYPTSDPRHEATRRLQRRLRTREPVAARGLVDDGLFGPATRAAVLAFQKRRGLDGDGIAGPLTLYRLGL